MTQKNNLVKNASFLMLAAIISKVIGLLYKSPLSNIIGSLGMGYTSLAQNAYMILLMISSFSIPQAVSKLVSEKIAMHEYRNAQKIFRGSLIYAVIVGGVVALFCLFGAGIIIPGNQKDAILALQILSPTIFLSGILGVFRGYFQAYRNMLPTSVSQILEQIFNAAVSLLAAWGFIRVFSDGSTNSVAKWGAAGSTVGTGAGVLTALLFMLMVYGINYESIQKRVQRDCRHREESYREIFRVIVLIVSPIILSAFVYNVNAYINGYLFSEILGRRGGDAAQIGILYAEYATYFMTIINIPLTLSSTAPTSMIPEVSALYATGDMRAVRECIDQTVQFSMTVSVPCAVGLAVLAQPIVFFLYGNSTGLAANLLILGSFTILLNGMSNISNGVLQAIGKPRIPVITAAIALGVDIIVVVALLLTTDLGVYALLIAMIVYSVVVCVLNDFAMKKYLRYRNPWVEGYLKPILASIPMGIVAGCICYGLNIFIKSNFVCLLFSVPVAAVVYLLSYLIISKPSEEEIRRIPGGSYMIRFARRTPFWNK
ncbi:MAG: polysaccharide biosynthesis protein [Blautia sp.]|nr:polysaccharide biosynthesis protein [Blautia sp.]